MREKRDLCEATEETEKQRGKEREIERVQRLKISKRATDLRNTYAAKGKTGYIREHMELLPPVNKI